MVPFPRSWRWENDGLLDALARLDPTNTVLFSVARLTSDGAGVWCLPNAGQKFLPVSQAVAAAVALRLSRGDNVFADSLVV